MKSVNELPFYNYGIVKTLAVKMFGEIVLLKHWQKKLWRIQGLPAYFSAR